MGKTIIRMATKEEALLYVRSVAESKLVTKEELSQAYDQGAGIQADAIGTKLGIAEILYYLGGAIVCIGIAILVGQNWSTLSFVSKLLATLGASVAAYVVAGTLSRDTRLEGVSAAFYLISALTMPVGLYVWLDNAGWNLASPGTLSLISFVLFVVYLTSFLVFRKTVLALFSILFGTQLFYALTNQMVTQNPYFDLWKFYEYRLLLSGFVYLLLGYYVSTTTRSALSGFLYGFGSIGFLGAALALGGWQPNQNAFWELLFPLLVFGALYLSVYLRSRALLTFGTLFLMAYIFKITSEYFTQGFGWPLSLVIAGLLMIAVGYMSFSINNKYIRS